MDLGALIETYGYWVLVIGCLLEGETLLVLGGFAASRGHLDLVAVMAIAAVSGFAGDQFFFWIGRRHGPAALARFPSVAAQAGRMYRLIERYNVWVIVGVRFAYGLRIAGPILIGSSRIRPLRFAVFNAIGAVLWASLVAGVGYVFGEAARALIGEIHSIEGWLLLALLVAAGLILLVRRARAQAIEPPHGPT